MATLGKKRQSMGIPRMKPVLQANENGKAAVVLKLWILRFYQGGVLVEGYKDVSEYDATTLQNWRSTQIATRIDAKTVQTHSGSIYKLKGGIDEEEAAQAGISEEVIDAFARGFPENWMDVVQEELKRMETVMRRLSVHSGKENIAGKSGKRFADHTEDSEDVPDEKERLSQAKKRRSTQKGRKSLLPTVQPSSPIEEEDDEGEQQETPKRSPPKKTPGRTNKRTPARTVQKETPIEKARPSSSKRQNSKEDEEVYFTPDGETPRRKSSRISSKDTMTPVTTVAVLPTVDKKRNSAGEARTSRTVPLEELPKEIVEKSVPLKDWVIRFVRGGTSTSIFPHFQFKVCGFRPECEDQEWCTSAIQKVVPPFVMFTTSSIYRLDGFMDVDQSTDMGFPPAFITDFLMGFPNDWEEKLESFFNKTFGPPPQPRIVELMSDGGTADEDRVDKRHVESASPSNKNSEKITVNGLQFVSREEKEQANNAHEDEEEELRKEARKVERAMKKEEMRAQRKAEQKKAEREKRFEKKINVTPNGVAVSRSGRTLRTPLARWAGETVTYDTEGNVVEMRGVTTVTKFTVGKSIDNQTERLAAHYGVDSPLAAEIQKERAIAPPSASLPKTPALKKSAADYRVYSDDEVNERFMFQQYKEMVMRQADATPAFNKTKPAKRKYAAVESSDPEAEEEERKREKKRLKKEERRRLKESEEEAGSSDDGWRRKKRTSKKKVVVKKEKTNKSSRSAMKQRKGRKKEESESEEDGESFTTRDEEAVTFNPSECSNMSGGGYSDMDIIDESDEEEEEDEEEQRKTKKGTAKRPKMWKKEELIRLRLAYQALDMNANDLWEKVAKSIGCDRTAEECKKAAKERLHIKIDEQKVKETSDESDDGCESGAASEDEDKKNRRKAKMDAEDDNRLEGVTARKGTAAYAVQMEEAKRKHMMSRASQDDVFKDAEKLPESLALPSVAVFDPDDSLLELEDFEAPQLPKQRNTKTARAAAVLPATPQLHSSLNSPFSSGQRRSARRSGASEKVDSPLINPVDITRYVHGLSRNMSMLSHSLVNKSKMVRPKGGVRNGRTVARAEEAIESAVKKYGKKKIDEVEEEIDSDADILDGI